ncbi:hypothetical protein G6321_00008910 [Bradyrhizobium barranii subsp. barranii]|uniref:Uncharacterized protein n=1 Tax=Bradyrhizobium barranii subsp. barranii TaxID=2823807 RepID=A0A7Z0Q816_9BRAD|nr:hypothetical protein [Bradyrhizobium barranii]UGX95250.1 hypothetical protein G6321_00008910 [Bradyrhizobium barranii subsp. barranii]
MQQKPLTDGQQMRPAHQTTAVMQHPVYKPATIRKTPGHVTRVVADLMVFAEVDESGPFGLVFMPDVIQNYSGEHLQDIGVVVGATLAVIVWDIETRLVSHVVIASTATHPPAAAM